jgi:hypothetical protein
MFANRVLLLTLPFEFVKHTLKRAATQNQRRPAAATSVGSGSSLAVKWRRNGAS